MRSSHFLPARRARRRFLFRAVVPDGNAAKYARSFIPSYSLFVPLQNVTAMMGATGLSGVGVMPSSLQSFVGTGRSAFFFFSRLSPPPRFFWGGRRNLPRHAHVRRRVRSILPHHWLSNIRRGRPLAAGGGSPFESANHAPRRGPHGSTGTASRRFNLDLCPASADPAAHD